jgi:outer membrane murein-binding lipoprotein Lpp
VNIAQSWAVSGVLAAFGVTIVGLMAQLLTARVDQILTRVTGVEERLGARMDRLENRMDTLDRDVQAITNRVFRDGR